MAGLTLQQFDPELLARAHGWRVEGDALVRELSFRDFDESMRFLERVGQAAEDYKRRPDMSIAKFNRVRLVVQNRHHAGFTRAEMRLAAKVDAIVGEHHPGAVSH